MPCYHPLEGYRSRFRNPSGKRGIVFNRRDAHVDQPVTVPCGQCIGCRLERSRQWAIRCVHESSLHDDNCFLTLTYDDDHLPATGTLVKKHFQDFMKRLRKRFSHKKIMYFHCGEYGETTARPHYHAILFGHDFSDKELIKEKNDNKIYFSETLQSLWGHGLCSIGAVTFESAAYVARYVMKKVTGEAAQSHYERIVPETGEIVNLLPEYITMSLKPAIGKNWYLKFNDDVWPDDFVVMRGKKMKPPKYYQGLYELEEPDSVVQLKLDRIKAASLNKAESTPERLAIREHVKKSQIKQLSRKEI